MLRDVKAEMEALRKRFQAAYKADQRKRKREVSAVHDGPMREQGYSDAGIPGRAVYLKPLPGGGFDYRIPDAYGDDERHGEEDSVGEWELDRIAEKVAIPGHFAFWLSVRYPNRWCMD